LAFVVAVLTAPAPADEELEKVTLYDRGGVWAQSKAKPMMGTLPEAPRSTVRLAGVLERRGCHFVETAPSTAERGN